MLIGFIGSPSSGKTTTAALVFADLKDMGVTAEFIPEQARTYIAEKRLSLRQTPGSSVHLDDDDQRAIMLRQMRYEEMLLQSTGQGSLIVTDSSVFNTLIYMSDTTRSEVTTMLREHLKKYQFLFYCAPVKMPASCDPNRVHNQEEALKLDHEIPKLLEVFDLKPTILTGTSSQRRSVVTRKILEGLAS